MRRGGDEDRLFFSPIFADDKKVVPRERDTRRVLAYDVGGHTGEGRSERREDFREE